MSANESNDIYSTVRRFADNVPKNVAMLLVTQWHVIAAELLRRTADALQAADDLIASYDGATVSLEAAAELKARLAVVHNTLRRTKSNAEAQPQTEVANADD